MYSTAMEASPEEDKSAQPEAPAVKDETEAQNQ